MMVWIAMYMWLSGVYFLLNMFNHHAILVMRENKKKYVFILGKEGVVQG